MTYSFKNNKIAVLLDNIRSAQNVGSVFRTCDALGVTELLLSGITAQPPHRQLHKSALGAEQQVPWTHYPNVTKALDYLQQQNYTLFALETNQPAPRMLSTNCFDPYTHIALCVGNEIHGLSPQTLTKANYVLEIPQRGHKTSLNVAVALAIALWEAVR